MIWAAMTLAFFGFLRLGEMTCKSPYSPVIHLSPGDITYLSSFNNPEYMSVRIKVSKTDPFRSGQTIIIGKIDLIPNPITPHILLRCCFSWVVSVKGIFKIF